MTKYMKQETAVFNTVLQRAAGRSRKRRDFFLESSLSAMAPKPVTLILVNVSINNSALCILVINQCKTLLCKIIRLVCMCIPLLKKKKKKRLLDQHESTKLFLSQLISTETVNIGKLCWFVGFIFFPTEITNFTYGD